MIMPAMRGPLLLDANERSVVAEELNIRLWVKREGREGEGGGGEKGGWWLQRNERLESEPKIGAHHTPTITAVHTSDADAKNMRRLLYFLWDSFFLPFFFFFHFICLRARQLADANSPRKLRLTAVGRGGRDRSRL